MFLPKLLFLIKLIFIKIKLGDKYYDKHIVILYNILYYIMLYYIIYVILLL